MQRTVSLIFCLITAVQAASTTTEEDLIVVIARNGDIFFGALFGNFNSALPITLFLLILLWIGCYYIGRRYRDSKLAEEMQRYQTLATNQSSVMGSKATVLASVVVEKFNGSAASLLSSDYSPTSLKKKQEFIQLADIKSSRPSLPLPLPQQFDKAIVEKYGKSPALHVPKDMIIDFDSDIKLVSKIAEGGGGAVWKAELLNDSLQRKAGCISVAVKILKPTKTMSFTGLKAVTYYELAVMKLLGHHPNIIRLVGYTEEPLTITTKLYEQNLHGLVANLAQYADLTADMDSALAKHIWKESKLKGLLVGGFEMLPEISLHLAWSIASGMAELHRFNILHRDLKSANILIETIPLFAGRDRQPWSIAESLTPLAREISGLMNQNSLAGGLGWGKDSRIGRPYCPLNAVIIDFGLAKVIRSPNEQVPAGSLPDLNNLGISYHYAAPEAFDRLYANLRINISNGRSVKEEGKPVDVYSFGMTCWEMLERRVPFQKLSNKEVETKVKSGMRPAISECYRDFSQLPDGNRHYQVLVKCIRQCWKQNPKDRPTFEELKRKLRPFWLGPVQPE